MTDITVSGRARDEVAVFVDFENIRYSTINSYGREPDPVQWRDMALRYGLMSVAKAYADFDQHPQHVRTRLDVAGFEMNHYPAKRTTDSLGREKIASRSDLNLVVDIINTALVRPDIKTILLFSGDKDFIRLVTTLRNRLGIRVVICGVPGSISPDLVAAAGEEDPIEIQPMEDIDVSVIQSISVYIAQLHDGFVPTQSHMSRSLWRFVDRSKLPSEHIEAKVMEFLRKQVLVKRSVINGQGNELVTTELNIRHPLVREALDLEPEEPEAEEPAATTIPVATSTASADTADDASEDGTDRADGDVPEASAGNGWTSDDEDLDEPQPPNLENRSAMPSWMQRPTRS